MGKSTRRPPPGKRATRPSGFPLWKHTHTGRWCKKVRGKLHYFGNVADDPDGAAALTRWNAVKDDLLAGENARRPSSRGLTVADACNAYLEFKDNLLKSGELQQRTWNEYKATCEEVVACFGRGLLVDKLRPAHFQQLRAKMAARVGPVRLGNEIQRTRAIFKYALEADLIDRAPKYGPGFKKPSAKTLRKERAARGSRDFKPAEIWAILNQARPAMKAMILLGINGGLGNTDVALLTAAALDLEAGWLNYPRPKTGIARKVPLWPETIAAIREAIATRPEPKDAAAAALLFLGGRGKDYIGGRKGYRVDQEFHGIAKRAGVTGRSFYDLRRTFQTVGEDSHDETAVRAIMGHADRSDDMSARYRQRVSDERLQRVADIVRTWLLSGREPDQAGTDGEADQPPAILKFPAAG